MATTRQQPVRRAPAAPRRSGPRRLRVAVRRVNPWSVLKFSLLFYFCLMLVVLIGLAILYLLVDAMGILDSVEDFIGSIGFGERPPGADETAAAVFRIDGGFLFRVSFLIGVISVILWSALTVFFAFLYNLIADLVGGIEVTLSERR